MSLEGDFERDYREYLRAQREASQPELEAVALSGRPDGRNPTAPGPCGDSGPCLDSCLDACLDACIDSCAACTAFPDHPRLERTTKA